MNEFTKEELEFLHDRVVMYVDESTKSSDVSIGLCIKLVDMIREYSSEKIHDCNDGFDKKINEPREMLSTSWAPNWDSLKELIDHKNRQLGNLGTLIMTAVGLGLFIRIVAYEVIEEYEYKESYIKRLGQAFLLSSALLFITCFIPTKQEVLQLKAISIVSELKGAKKIPQKLVNLLNDVLSDKK